MQKKLLVVGATGMLGRPVAYQLNQDGYKVRVLTHSPSKAEKLFGNDFEIYQGDVTDPSSLKNAVDGCDMVYINLGAKFDKSKYEEIEYKGTVNLIEAAKEAGVKRIGMISGNRVEKPDTGILYFDVKAKAEEAIRESGIPYTIFKCCWFFESLPLFIQGGKAIILGKQANPIYWISAADYAGMVSRGMELEEAKNRSFYIKGLTQMSITEAMMKFCEIVIPEAKLSYIPLWMAKFASIFSRKPQMKGLIEFMSYFDKNEEPGVSGEAERILGPALTPIDDWCEEYKKRLVTARK